MVKYKDEEYLDWIRQQPCCICSYKSKVAAQYALYDDASWKTATYLRKESGRLYGLNAAHHVGDGLSSPRDNDYLTVPLCDFYCDPYGCRCHEKVHRSIKDYRGMLTKIACSLRRLYES